VVSGESFASELLERVGNWYNLNFEGMGGFTTFKAKGFYQQDLNDDATKGGGALGKAGTHFDVRHTINNYAITASFTDSTIKDLDNGPWLRDAVFTLESKEG
jgi:hypothetical protein